jgi:hypothetical protein
MKLRHKKFQDGGLPKGEKLKIKKYKCKQGEICEFTVKTKNHTHSKQRHFTMLGGKGNDTKILQMLMSCMNYMLKRLSKLCRQDPGLQGCVLATSGILIVHLCIYILQCFHIRITC